MWKQPIKDLEIRDSEKQQKTVLKYVVQDVNTYESNIECYSIQYATHKALRDKNRLRHILRDGTKK